MYTKYSNMSISYTPLPSVLSLGVRCVLHLLLVTLSGRNLELWPLVTPLVDCMGLPGCLKASQRPLRGTPEDTFETSAWAAV